MSGEHWPIRPDDYQRPDHGHEPQHGNSMREVLEEVETASLRPSGNRVVVLTEPQWEVLRKWLSQDYRTRLERAAQAARGEAGRIGIILRDEAHAEVSWYDGEFPHNQVIAFERIAAAAPRA